MIYDHTTEDQGKTIQQREDSLKLAFFIFAGILTALVGYSLFVMISL